MTYIEREALEAALNKRLKFLRDAYGDYDHYTDGFEEAVVRVEEAAAADVAPVKHGSWLLQANKENANYRWNVTAECGNCHFSKGEIWAGFFPGFSDELAMNVSLDSAESCELPNYCEHCGSKMDWED